MLYRVNIKNQAVSSQLKVKKISKQNSNRLAVQVAVLCIVLTEVTALFMWFSTKKTEETIIFVEVI